MLDRQDGNKELTETLGNVSTASSCCQLWQQKCNRTCSGAGSRKDKEYPINIHPLPRYHGETQSLDPLSAASVCIVCVHPEKGFEERPIGMMAKSDHPSPFPCTAVNENCCCRRSWQLQGHQRGGKKPLKTQASV